jgi:carbamoyltransferase
VIEVSNDYYEKENELISNNTKAVYKKLENFNNLSEFIAKKISEGNVIGWFQGRMEFGPRALGNRSILGDAKGLEMQQKLNLKIKYRENFRPFAPSVLSEKTQDYFDLEKESPYMLFVAPIKKEIRNKLPENYPDLPLKDKFRHKRSKLQAITHLDFSARIKTVHKDTNPRYWNLINEFEKLTGYGVIINTSMNVRGEPIVCNPTEAYRCFMSTEMDYLVINDYIYCKTEQPDWENRKKWLVKFQTD